MLVSVLVEPTPTQELCHNCKSSRIPIVRVYDKTDYAIENLEVVIETESVASHGQSGYFSCNTVARRLRYQTLDSLRTFNACRLEANGTKAWSDSFGKILITQYSVSMYSTKQV